MTIPDPDALDRLRTRNRVYDQTLQPRECFMGGNPTGVRSLLVSLRESSMEPMDTDEGARTTREIAESIRLTQGRVRAGSMGHLSRGPGQPPTAERGTRLREMGEEPQDRGPRRGADREEGPSLLQIPLCVMAGPSEEEDPSLHHPALADATCDLDRRPGNRAA